MTFPLSSETAKRHQSTSEHSSETRRFQDLDVLKNDKLRFEEWGNIFSSFRTSLNGVPYSSFPSFSNKLGTASHLPRRQDKNQRGEGAQTSRSIVGEPKKIHKWFGRVLRAVSLDDGDRNKKNYNGLTGGTYHVNGGEDSLEAFNGQKRIHTTSTHKVAAANQPSINRVRTRQMDTDGKHNAKQIKSIRGSPTIAKKRRDRTTQKLEAHEREQTLHSPRSCQRIDKILETSEQKEVPTDYARNKKINVGGALYIGGDSPRDSWKIHARYRNKVEVERNPAPITCCVYRRGNIIINIRPFLQLGVQISNDVGVVVRETLTKVERMSLDSQRSMASKFCPRCDCCYCSEQ